MTKAIFMMMVLTGFGSMASAQQEYGAEFFKEVAKPVTEVKTTELTLLGKGIRERGGDRSVAIACLNAECTQLRFVYFGKNKGAFFIGPEYDYSGKTMWVTSSAVRAGSRQILKQIIEKIQTKSWDEFKDAFIDDGSDDVKIAQSEEGWKWSARQKRKDAELFRELLCAINQHQPIEITEGSATEIISCGN
jgi:hypothetical protein